MVNASGAAHRSVLRLVSVGPGATARRPRRVCSILLATVREELADGQQQTRQRQHDEQDLVDVVLARRQPAHQVNDPEGRIEPQREPGPPFPTPERDHSDQHAEQAHANRGQAVSP